MVAQRYAGLFDGGLRRVRRLVYWEQWVGEVLTAGVYEGARGVRPHGCEYDALRGRVLEVCDGIDGVRDGILQEPGRCGFDAGVMVGESVECGGGRV